MAIVAPTDSPKPAGNPGGLRGAVPRIEDLIALRSAARHCVWQLRTQVRSARTGTRASRFRGRGIDFAETRVYEPGDDMRHIDWRVTARTGKTHTKIFQEERERPVLVVADLGPSSFFGTRRRMKSMAVTELTSLLVWAAFDSGDRIGAIVRGPLGLQAFRPRHSRATVLRIQQRLVADTHALAKHCCADAAPLTDARLPPSSLSDALVQARRITRPGTTVIVISDFLDSVALDTTGEVRRNLRLLTRHCTVDAVLVSDPLERELPEANRYPLTDRLKRIEFDTAPQATRRAWRDAFIERQTLLETSVRGGRGRLLSVGTEEDLDTCLGAWLR